MRGRIHIGLLLAVLLTCLAGLITAGLVSVPPLDGLAQGAQAVLAILATPRVQQGGLVGLSLIGLIWASWRGAGWLRQQQQQARQQAYAQGNADGAAEVLAQLRALEHGHLKAHTAALERCLRQARTHDPAQQTAWLDAALTHNHTLHDLVVTLHSSMTASALPLEQGLDVTMQQVVGLVGLAYPQIAVRWQHPPTPIPRVPDDQLAALLLIAYNALHNAVTHAHPQQVWVQLLLGADRLTLRVTDDGCGFDTRRSHNGRGLTDMQAAMDRCGGTLTLVPVAPHGTTVQAAVPLPRESPPVPMTTASPAGAALPRPPWQESSGATREARPARRR